MAGESNPYGRPYDEFDSAFSWRPLVSGRVPGKTWESIVQDYSKRELTNPSDKLAAIAGIAAKFADFQKDKYFAGHFSSTLPQSLLWNRSYVCAKRTEGAYVAPSWSWASAAEPLSEDVQHIEDEKAVAEVKKIEVGLKNPKNRFGQITSGSIVLEGPLFGNQQFDYVPAAPGQTPIRWLSATGTIIPGLSSHTQINFDVAKDTLDGRALSFFCITPTRGLVLVKLDQNTYERVGTYRGQSFERLEIADKTPWRKVKIV